MYRISMKSIDFTLDNDSQLKDFINSIFFKKILDEGNWVEIQKKDVQNE